MLLTGNYFYLDEKILDIKDTVSPKKYGVAVCLSGIFGILGIHHFYLERWGMGIFDLSLSISGFILIGMGNNWGFALIFIDVIHAIYVTYKLLVGGFADGNGRILTYPGQKITHQKNNIL